MARLLRASCPSHQSPQSRATGDVPRRLVDGRASSLSPTHSPRESWFLPGTSRIAADLRHPRRESVARFQPATWEPGQVVVAKSSALNLVIGTYSLSHRLGNRWTRRSREHASRRPPALLTRWRRRGIPRPSHLTGWRPVVHRPDGLFRCAAALIGARPWVGQSAVACLSRCRLGRVWRIEATLGGLGCQIGAR